MADGKWNSGVFEPGRDGQKTRVLSAQGRAAAMEAGTTPALYNPTPMESGKDSRTIGIVTVVLRSLLIVFTLITLGLMAASKQDFTKTDSGTTSDGFFISITSSVSYNFTQVHAFVGLLSVASIVCFYSIVQLVLCVVQVLSTGTFIPSATTGGSLLTFIFDSVLAYALMGAAAAAADFQGFMKQYKYCDVLSKFCGTSSASVAIAFIAFILLATCAALFPIRLYKMSLSR